MKINQKILGLTLVVALNMGFGSPARADDAVSDQDKSFVMAAAQGGMTEVEMGKLAESKGTTKDVRDFGAKMVADHGKANNQLKGIAKKNGLTLDDKLDAKHQEAVDHLSGLSGAAFDSTYVDAMVDNHQADAAAFASEAQTGTNPDIKAFADDTLKVVKMHLSMIQAVQHKQTDQH